MKPRSPETTSQRVRVALLVDKLDAGGAERHALSLAAGLDPAAFSVSLISLKPGGVLEPQAAEAGLDQSACANVGRKLDLPAARRLHGLLEAEKADVIVATNPYATLYAVLASRMMQSPRPAVVATFHSTDLPGIKNHVQMLFYRSVFPAVDALVYVCENQRRYWRRRALRARTDLVIHNGIDTTRFGQASGERPVEEIRRDLGFAPTDYVIGVCAALRPEKSHEDLVRAIAALRAQSCPARLLVIGDGPRRPQIEALARSLGIATDVKITGFQSDVRPFVAACDVMALPSRSETFSLAVLEAMAAGKPMVLSRTGGAEEQITDGVTGYLFTPGAVSELVERLELLGDPDRRRRLGQSALEDVRNRFPVELMLRRYESLLGRLANRRNGANVTPG